MCRGVHLGWYRSRGGAGLGSQLSHLWDLATFPKDLGLPQAEMPTLVALIVEAMRLHPAAPEALRPASHYLNQF